MAPTAFVLRSRLGRRIYVLSDDALEVTFSRLGPSRSVRIPLGRIAADYEVKSARYPWAIALCFAPVAVAIVAYRLLGAVKGIPIDLRVFVLGLAAPFAVAAIKLIPRFDFYVFYDHWKRPLFTIPREPAQAAECDAFIHALLDRVEGREDRSAPVEGPQPAAEYLWAIALTTGAATALYPAALAMFPDYVLESAMLVVAVSAAAILCSIYSFGKKERRRYWSLAGAGLAVVGIVAYASIMHVSVPGA